MKQAGQPIGRLDMPCLTYTQVPLSLYIVGVTQHPLSRELGNNLQKLHSLAQRFMVPLKSV